MDLEHKKQIREFKQVFLVKMVCFNFSDTWILKLYFQTVTDQNVKLTNLDNLILSQQSLIAAQAEQIKVQDSRLEELALKQIESDRKMTELLTDGLDPKPAAASSCKRKRGSTGEDDEETGSAASATKRKRRSDQKWLMVYKKGNEKR